MNRANGCDKHMDVCNGLRRWIDARGWVDGMRRSDL
jgi:hypothetical protein